MMLEVQQLQVVHKMNERDLPYVAELYYEIAELEEQRNDYISPPSNVVSFNEAKKRLDKQEEDRIVRKIVEHSRKTKW